MKKKVIPMFFSKDGDGGTLVIHTDTEFDGGDFTLTGHDSNGDGTFRYPTIQVDEVRKLNATVSRVKKAFVAGKIYVPNIFDDPYYRSAYTARVTYMRVVDPKFAASR